MVKITHVAAKTTPIFGVFQSYFHRLSEVDFTDFEVRTREFAEPFCCRLQLFRGHRIVGSKSQLMRDWYFPEKAPDLANVLLHFANIANALGKLVGINVLSVGRIDRR